MTGLVARQYATGARLRIGLDGPTIARVEPDGPPRPEDPWVAPAFWDVQTNGRLGVSFNDPGLTPGQVAEIVHAQDALGTARICPTLFTAPFEAFVAGLGAVDRACRDDPGVASRVLGVHLEGPYISGLDGYRGAHPPASVRDPDWDEFRRFQDAAGGRVVLLTLAPERPGSIPFIEKLVGSGVAVAIGHTSADGPTLRDAARAGATLSTHLGNGIAATLPRHPNPIWEQAAIDGLDASLIADGHHVDDATLRVLVRAKTPGRVVLVSDASSLAGLPTGRYGDWAVDPSGKVVVAGTPYLAGSNRDLAFGVNTVMRAAGLGLAEAVRCATANPARLLGRDEPRLEPGAPANLVVFRFEEGADAPFRLLRTCVDGLWTEAQDGTDGTRRIRR